MIWRKAKDSLFVDKDLDVPIPPYLPNTEIAKQDIRRNYSNIVEMDKRVGEILGELEQAGQLENTIVFWYSDHGGPLPREKRTIYNTGLQVPMIIRFPNKQLAGSTDSQMLSFIDLKPTVLSLVNIKPPDNLDGKAWMGKYAEHNKREYLFAAADRFDQQIDKIRAVFNKKFKLIRNYNTQQPYYLPVKYRETMPIMKELLRLRDKDSLTLEQQLWFRKTKDSIEFFDMENDPYEFHNLADKKEYQDKIGEMKSALDHWIKSTDDKGQLTEDDYIASIWPNGEQPKTAEPKLTIGNGEVSVSTETTGASIGYQWAKDESELTNSWDIYTGPIPIKPHNTLYVRAHRIGFKPSERVEQKF
jgi:arylsulfatase A-like enzyme